MCKKSSRDSGDRVRKSFMQASVKLESRKGSTDGGLSRRVVEKLSVGTATECRPISCD